MNYKLIMTEGPDELAFINVPLDKRILAFSKKELLMEQAFHKRQIDGELIGYIQGLQSGDNIDIYRIGDKLSDSFKIPRAILSEKINNKFKICTLPEFEMLFIIKEGLYVDYLKVKSIQKPSEFYKSHHKDYKKQADYVKSYFSKMTGQEIIELINMYVQKHGRAHDKDELTLKNIIKEKKSRKSKTK